VNRGSAFIEENLNHLFSFRKLCKPNIVARKQRLLRFEFIVIRAMLINSTNRQHWSELTRAYKFLSWSVCYRISRAAEQIITREEASTHRWKIDGFDKQGSCGIERDLLIWSCLRWNHAIKGWRLRTDQKKFYVTSLRWKYTSLR